MASTANRTPLDTAAEQAARSPTHRPPDPAADRPTGPREPELGIPKNPRRTPPTRAHHRRLNNLEDSQSRRYQPHRRSDRAHMVGVHSLTIQSNHRHRLRVRRHRSPQTVPCPIRRRTRNPTRPPSRNHDQPHWTMDCTSGTQPDHAPRRASPIPILDPRRSRTIHPLIRHRPRRVQNHRHSHNAEVATSKRIRRTMGSDYAPRPLGPDDHLERTPTPRTAPRIRRALRVKVKWFVLRLCVGKRTRGRHARR